MARNDNIFSQIRNSRLAKAASETLSKPQPFGRAGNALINFDRNVSQPLLKGLSAAPKRIIEGYGAGASNIVNRSIPAYLTERQADRNLALAEQGLPQERSITPAVRKLDPIGVSQGQSASRRQEYDAAKRIGGAGVETMLFGKGLGASPKLLGGIAATSGALSGGLTAAQNALTGNKDSVIGATARGVSNAPIYAGINPITQGFANNITRAGVPFFGAGIASPVGRRLAGGVAETVEDQVLTRTSEGRAPTPIENTISFAVGSVFGGADEQVQDEIIRELKKSGGQVKLSRDKLGQFAKKLGQPEQIVKEQMDRIADIPVATTEFDANGKRVIRRMGDIVDEKTKPVKDFMQDQNKLVRVEDKDGTVRWVKKGEAGFISLGKGSEPKIGDVVEYKGDQWKIVDQKGVSGDKWDLKNVQTGSVARVGKTEVVSPTTPIKQRVLNDLNPTGSVLVDYDPQSRMKMPLGENMTTLDVTSGKNPNDMVTIYRGVSKPGREINPGDFVSTDYNSAKSYTGTGNILSKRVKYSDILDDSTQPLGGDYIYRPGASKEIRKTTTNIFGQTIPEPDPKQAGFIRLGSDTTPPNKTIKTIEQKKNGLNVKEKTYNEVLENAKKEIGKIESDPSKNIREFADNFYTQWVNRFAPIERLSQNVKGKLKTKQAELRPEFDPEYLIRRFTGAGGVASTKYETELKPIVNQMEERGITKEDMDVFLKARRDVGLSQRGIKGSNGDLATERLGVLRDMYTGIDEVADQLYKYQNGIFQELIDAGFISKDMGDFIRQQNPDYVPFNRIMDEVENYLGVPSNKLQQGTQPIKKIKGSDKQIYSPIESIIANTFSHRAAIEKNRVAKSIVNLAQVDPELNFNKVSKSGRDTITVWNNGQKEYYQVGKDIADVVKAVDEESMNAVLKIFQAPASILRQGATGRNPDFMIPNIVKDQFDAGVSSKYGYIPFIDYVSGLISMKAEGINNLVGRQLVDPQVYQRWANSGAKIDLGELSGRKSIQKSFDEATKRKGLLSWISSGLDVAGKYSEEPTRVGLFKKAYNKTGNELLAAMESRDATVDFARMGSKMKVANSVIPFLNVGIQGFDKIIRTAKNNPGKLALHAGVYGALPAVTTTLYNLMNHKDEYLEIPQYVKDTNFVMVNGRNEDGTVDYFTIPKGNIIPMVSNPVESFLSYLAGNDEQTLAEFANQFISSSLPVIGEGKTPKEIATKTIGGNLPQLIKPVTENLLNRSFYKFDENKQESKEIVPFYLKDKEAYQQAYEWTPETYKAMGAALNVSPLQIQNVMEGYLAGYTKVPSQVVGILNDISKGEDVRKNDIPIVRRFISTTFPSSDKQPPVSPPRTPFFERITGKAQASGDTNKVFTSEARDRVKDKLKYGMEVTQNELEQTYLHKPLSMKASNRYEKSLRESELWSSISTIENDEKLSQSQRQTLKEKIAQELNLTTQDIDKYSVAKQDNDTKTLYTLDQFDNFKSFDDMMRYLVQGRKPLNGKILISDGVINNLVNDGLISDQMGRDLKNLDLNPDGTLKQNKKKGSRASGTSKATKKYFKALARVKPSSSKFVAPSVASKLNVKNLTLT